MTAIMIDGQPYVPQGRWRKAARDRAMRLMSLAGTVVIAAVPAIRSKARPLAVHLRDHVYAIAGFSLIDAAMFTHSVFRGLLVAGVSFLVFEWKVSE